MLYIYIIVPIPSLTFHRFNLFSIPGIFDEYWCAFPVYSFRAVSPNFHLLFPSFLLLPSSKSFLSRERSVLQTITSTVLISHVHKAQPQFLYIPVVLLDIYSLLFGFLSRTLAVLNVQFHTKCAVLNQFLQAL